MGPVNSPFSRLRNSLPPIEASLRLAPITATEWGKKIGMREAATARFSRSHSASFASAEAVVGSSTA